jgi:hypothetical protein
MPAVIISRRKHPSGDPFNNNTAKPKLKVPDSSLFLLLMIVSQCHRLFNL